jgi:ABC-type glycerol-3-phosphate transport system permease component
MAAATAGRTRGIGAGTGQTAPVRQNAAVRGRAFGWYLVAGVAISAVFVLPLAWEVFRSLQPESTVTAAPSGQSFAHLTFANYKALLSGQDDIIRNVVNSLIVAVVTALLTSFWRCSLATASRSSGSAGPDWRSAWYCSRS